MANGDSTARDRAARWWQFGRPTMLLYNTIKELDRILVKTQVSRYWTFEYASPGIVFDQRLIVFADEHITLFMLLQSEIHWTWASQYSSTMKQDMSYTPTDVFQTFPLIDERLVSVKVGILYHELRSKIMKQRSEGLTKVTQRISEPTETSADIAELRRLHAEMDNAVAAAYGWADLDLGHGFHDTKQGLRYTISEAARRTVLDRLLALNHERYAEEVAAGLHEKKKGIGDRVSGIGKKGRKKSPEPQTPNPEPQMEQGEMF